MPPPADAANRPSSRPWRRRPPRGRPRRRSKRRAPARRSSLRPPVPRATGPNSELETHETASRLQQGINMNAFYNLRIASKLLISFVVVLALTVFVGVFSVMQLSKVNQMSTDITTNWMPATRSLLEMKGLMARYRSMELQHILSSTEADMAGYEKSMTDAWASLQK